MNQSLEVAKLQYEKANKGFQKQIKFFHWGDVEKSKRISNEKDKEIKDFLQLKLFFDKWKQISRRLRFSFVRGDND